MESPQRPPGRFAFRRLLFGRGESESVPIGAMMGMILLCVLAASTWWTYQSHRDSVARERVREIEAVGCTLTQASEPLLAAGEVSALRRIVVEVRREHELEYCRIVTPDGLVLADGDPSQIRSRRDQQAAPPAGSSAKGVIQKSFRLVIPGKGPMKLELGGKVAAVTFLTWEASIGLAGIGAVGLLLLWIVYRSTRRRLRSLGAIREALAIRSAGQTSAGALHVDEGLGPQASQWNAFVAEYESLRTARTLAEVGSRLVEGGRGQQGLTRACDAMHHGLVLVGSDLRISYINGAGSSFLGRSRDQIVGASVLELIQEESIVAVLRSAAEGGTFRPASAEVAVPGDSSVLRYSVRPVRKEDSVSAMIVIEDVTQKHVARKATNAFVAQATHELRTPLTNIRLYLETLMEDAEMAEPKSAGTLNIINQETRRLERMVSDMLSVAEMEAGSLKIRKDDVRLGELLAGLEADYQAQAQEKGIRLTFDLPPKLPVVQGDQGKIAMALHNLVGNALKYTPEGGEVRLSASTTPRQVRIEVADTGIGIAEGDLERVFERFYRAQDRRVAKATGSGLGLALAREVVRLHGGEIEAESRLDEGSCFTMTLPLSGVEAA